MVNSTAIETRLLEHTVNENSDFQNEATFSNHFSLEVFGMMLGSKLLLCIA